MRTPRPSFEIRFTTFAALGAAALFSSAAHAADLGLQPLPPLTESVASWTGASLAVGGGIGILTSDVKARASRLDEFGFCTPDIALPECEMFNPYMPDGNPVFVAQDYQLNVRDLSDDGIFGTIQAAYDWQIASRWVGGVFVDADLYDINARANQTSSVSTGGVAFTQVDTLANHDFTLGEAILDARTGIDWSLSVGGRFGYLATPDVLLYVLAAYTHAELENTRLNVTITDPALPSPTADPALAALNTQHSLILPDEVEGFSLGTGSEVRLGGGWSLKGEYRYTWLEGVGTSVSRRTVQCCGEAEEINDHARRIKSKASVDMDLDLHTVRGMLAYRF